MKKRLIEKITKTTRNFNTFKGFLAEQKTIRSGGLGSTGVK
jgi:hypothetical protein